MKKINYWIWLRKVLGQNANIKRVLESDFTDGDPRRIYEADPLERRESGLFSKGALERMNKTGLEFTYDVLEDCARESIDILTPEDAEYPWLLKYTENFPIVLFSKGNSELLWKNEKLPLAIVGTRNATNKGLKTAEQYSSILSEYGFLIVSGGALGIDTASHIGALKAECPTVAVLGSGIGAKYLKTNRSLRKSISENGVVLSEMFPYEEPHRGSFPLRNRILAGMTAGTLVVEAGKRSGSVITAGLAGEYGRSVFVIPGETDNPPCAGVNQLIDDGATPIIRPLDIVSELKPSYPFFFKGLKDMEKLYNLTESLAQNENSDLELNNRTVEQFKRKDIEFLSETAQNVYNCFSNNSLSVDEIIENQGIPSNKLLGALAELEVSGFIELLPNRKYRIKGFDTDG